MERYAYFINRTLWTIPVLIGISLITFVLMHLVPGGPWDPEAEGRQLAPTVIANLNAKYGLDRPLHEQYLIYMGNVLRGDLGVSIIYQDRPITGILRDGLPPTMTLGLMALGISLAIGIPLGIIAALRQNTVVDYVSLLVATAGASVPSFVLAILLVLVFAVNLRWFGVSGWVPPTEDFGEFLKHATIPAVCLSFFPTAFLARLTRSSMLEVLRHDYVTTARAKGLREYRVVTRHVLRNALIPVATVAGPLTAGLITGSFIIETFFSVPGIGRLFIQAVGQRDYNMVMGTTLVFTAVIALANLLVDITYGIIDPRVRLD